MGLIAFSIRTKGLHNFARRLWTVFARFGFSERRIRRALHAIIFTMRQYDGVPTFYIPAVVLRRHPRLMAEIAGAGAEIGIHAYIHIDYHELTKSEQLVDTKRAITVFRDVEMPFRGFRNPYLGWTDDSLAVYRATGFLYESNEAVLHDVIEPTTLAPHIHEGYAKSLALYQALPLTAYTLRPHIEDGLVRIPTSIPDDEMLYDRLRITSHAQVGRIWSQVMRNVYAHGGVYALNLHPERGIVCREALRALPEPVWMAHIEDIAAWWLARQSFRLEITPLEGERWHVQAHCDERARLMARHIALEMPSAVSSNRDILLSEHACVVRSFSCPAIGLSPRTPAEVASFLREQGYPVVVEADDQRDYALLLDLPEGLGSTRAEQVARRSELVARIEALETPLIRFAIWPDGYHAALAISGDIDSITVQDFFLRIWEVRQAMRRSARRLAAPAAQPEHGDALRVLNV
jgi:peptidoglycan/xylan/chitin deacetylase (PgdA/CDA1 family)